MSRRPRVVQSGPISPILDTDRGRGLILMRALMDEVTVEQGNAGTTVYLKARIF
ncbi:ATP-binding protein [Amycolatopsis azurea]